MEYKDYVVTFTDGTTHTQYANRSRCENGVLSIWTDSYGVRDMNNFPLVNVKSWTTK